MPLHVQTRVYDVREVAGRAADPPRRGGRWVAEERLLYVVVHLVGDRLQAVVTVSFGAEPTVEQPDLACACYRKRSNGIRRSGGFSSPG
jgi:hypothetical protein